MKTNNSPLKADTQDFQYQAENISFRLAFHPPLSDRSLRPWDAADEYIYSRLSDDDTKDYSKILTVNDGTGALSTILAERCVATLCDSMSSSDSIQKNRQKNNLETLPFYVDPQDIKGLDIDLIVLKIPKSLDLFKFQLQALQAALPEQTAIICASMSKYMPESFFAAFSEMSSDAKYSRIVKKARIYEGNLLTAERKSQFKVKTFSYQGVDFDTYPGTFSYGHLDMGTQFLVEHFPRKEDVTRIVDPGCGAGVLALLAAKKWPEASVVATDDSYSAVQSTKRSIEKNGLTDRVSVLHCDILSEVESESADLVICNPPFHQNQRVSVETGMRFIEESHRVLEDQGQLFLVANRHLGYQQTLEKLFPSAVMVLAQNKKFIIYMCRKNKESFS